MDKSHKLYGYYYSEVVYAIYPKTKRYKKLINIKLLKNNIKIYIYIINNEI